MKPVVQSARANAAAGHCGRLAVVVWIVLVPFLAACGMLYEAPVSGFRPLFPPQKFSLDRNKLSTVVLGNRQPTFRWEPFPGAHEAYGLSPEEIFVDVEPERVSDVTYELRVWKTVGEGESVGPVVYEKAGLRTTSHKIERPLDRATVYFWSVRARFRVDGVVRVSEWSMTSLPHYGATARTMARRHGAIPPANYYRFMTP